MVAKSVRRKSYRSLTNITVNFPLNTRGLSSRTRRTSCLDCFQPKKNIQLAFVIDTWLKLKLISVWPIQRYCREGLQTFKAGGVIAFLRISSSWHYSSVEVHDTLDLCSANSIKIDSSVSYYSYWSYLPIRSKRNELRGTWLLHSTLFETLCQKNHWKNIHWVFSI